MNVQMPLNPEDRLKKLYRQYRSLDSRDGADSLTIDASQTIDTTDRHSPFQDVEHSLSAREALALTAYRQYRAGRYDTALAATLADENAIARILDRCQSRIDERVPQHTNDSSPSDAGDGWNWREWLKGLPSIALGSRVVHAATAMGVAAILVVLMMTSSIDDRASIGDLVGVDSYASFTDVSLDTGTNAVGFEPLGFAPNRYPPVVAYVTGSHAGRLTLSVLGNDSKASLDASQALSRLHASLAIDDDMQLEHLTSQIETLKQRIDSQDKDELMDRTSVVSALKDVLQELHDRKTIVGYGAYQDLGAWVVASEAAVGYMERASKDNSSSASDLLRRVIADGEPTIQTLLKDPTLPKHQQNALREFSDSHGMDVRDSLDANYLLDAHNLDELRDALIKIDSAFRI